jgi:hypothetical protein
MTAPFDGNLLEGRPQVNPGTEDGRRPGAAGMARGIRIVRHRTGRRLTLPTAFDKQGFRKGSIQFHAHGH